ncbi:SURF1 family protein [Marinivivus vitaminiproducens]|uniref:SURF1 family protein n=1 Tax=Marinivivus vitaminiproducens TaxID=3035935 RepID=UPI0027A2D90C|nr:SURF1 family protein [Geminicoccaceae bacterium SCSIO 64248]
MSPSRSPLTLAVLGLLATLGVALLIGLGVWQVERRSWKLDLIGRVEQRVHAEPVAAPAPDAWPSVTAARDEYRRVRVRGTFLHERETLVQAVTERGGGFWVVTPLRADNGSVVLVNRGFVPTDHRDPADRAPGQVAGEATVVGLVRMTEPEGGFLRANDPEEDRWYSRDVAAIASARGLSDVAPYFIDADGTANPGGLPVGGLTVIAFRNTHLVYALTWFTLASMLAGAGLYLGREEWRSRRRPAETGRRRPAPDPA